MVLAPSRTWPDFHLRESKACSRPTGGYAGLSLGKTFRQNSGIFPFYFLHGRRLLLELADFQPDVFITAFEPFTTFAAHQLRKPLISMDNQNELRNMEQPPGTNAFSFHLTRLATRVVTYGGRRIYREVLPSAGADARQHAPGSPPSSSMRSGGWMPTHGSHVLVYLTKENPGLTDVLKTIDEPFIVYCFNRVGQDGNLTYRRQGPTFLPDLRDCKAIIGTTGFSLIADAIYLKKPYFGVPLKGQFEQAYNGQFLADSGLGDCSENPTRWTARTFLGPPAPLSCEAGGI